MIIAFRSSTAVTCLTHIFMSKANSKSGELSLSMLSVKTMSRAVNGWPSLQVTPERSLTMSWLLSALYAALSASQGMRASLPGSPTGHFTSRVQYGFQKNSGSYITCQPLRWMARRNGLASGASWNWVNVSETVMINVSLRATGGNPPAVVTTAGAADAAGAEAGAGAPDAGAGSEVGAGAAVAAWPGAGVAAAGFAAAPEVGAAGPCT